MKLVPGLISFWFISLGVFGQMRTVNGLVLTEEMEPVSHIFIYLHDSVETGRTDMMGKYEITIPDGINSITFRGVGYESLLMVLDQGCNRVEVIMILAGTYDFMSPAKVDRKRRRYFDKIKNLYPVAVQKGIFVSDPPCCKVVFQPDAPRMRRMHKQWIRKHHSK